MDGHTFLLLLPNIYFAVVATQHTDFNFTKGFDCSMEYQSLCSVRPYTNEESNGKQCNCRFNINVCLASENSIVFAYIPPNVKYGISESNVYLNLYDGADTEYYNPFRINLSTKTPCKFKDVLPGEYDVWMSPVDPSEDDYDYDYDDDDRCDCLHMNFMGNKVVVRPNNNADPTSTATGSTSSIITKLITTARSTYAFSNQGQVASGVIYSASIGLTTNTGSSDTDTLNNHNKSTSGERASTSGVMARDGDDNNSNRTTVSDKKIHPENHGLIANEVILTIALSSVCLLSFSLVLIIIVWRRYPRCCCHRKIVEIKQDSDTVKTTDKQQEEEEKSTGEKYDSGIQDWDNEEGFLQSDVATLQERCGNVYSETCQYSELSCDLYDYTQNCKSQRDPSIYPAITILDGTLEKTNYIHPFFDDITRDENSWIPSSTCSVKPNMIQGNLINQRDKQTHSSEQGMAVHKGNVHHYTVILQNNQQRDKSAFTRDQVSFRSECDEMIPNIRDKFEFIPPDSNPSECSDITSQIIEQRILEINRNYFWNISSDGNVKSNTNTSESRVNDNKTRESVNQWVFDQQCSEDMVHDGSDVSIGGISL